MIPRAATEYESRQDEVHATVLAGARKSWRQMTGRNWERTWRGLVGPQVVELVTTAQETTAAQSQQYMAAVLAELGIPADVPTSLQLPTFAGVAGDGRPVDSLLYGSVIVAAKSQYTPQMAAASATEVQHLALAAAGAWLDRQLQTILADTARAAETVALAQRPWVDGYIRMLDPKNPCSRCVVLAGKFYLHSKGFDRHPSCRCFHIPASENIAGNLLTNPSAYFDSLTTKQQDKVFTSAGAEAIRLGADIGQVVNARRGMNTAQLNPRGWIPKGRLKAVTMHGHNVFVTSEGVTKRGIYGKTAGRKPARLMPESILSLATDRDDALRLLKLYGFLR